MKKLERGFTLIELLIVIAIIGILSTVVIVSVNTARVRGRDTKRIADIDALKTALALYYDTHGYYPYSAGDAGLNMLVTDKLLPVVPHGPLGESYPYSVLSTSPVGNLSYHLGATLEQVKYQQGVLANSSNCDGTATIPPFCPGFGPGGPAAFSGPFDGRQTVGGGTACAGGVNLVSGPAVECYDVTP